MIDACRSVEIIAAWAEYQRLTACIRQVANPGAFATLRRFLERCSEDSIPLPGAAPKGTPGAATMYLAAVHHTNLKQVENVLSRYCSRLRRTGGPHQRSFRRHRWAPALVSRSAGR